MTTGAAAAVRGKALDIVAFAIGLAMAWHFGWRTKDLVWSLWLASLVVGYATIVLGVAGAARRRIGERPVATIAASLFLLAFFSVHFGGFHFVHSMFLSLFFPLGDLPFVPAYGRVVADYWPWLLPAAFAERRALLDAALARPALATERDGLGGGPGDLGFHPLAAYKNVIRMHLLIFAFAACALLGLENFVVYALVYAVYFWPWSVRNAPSAPPVA